MRKWRKLSLGFYAAAFGYRFEIDLVPFQLAWPQFGLSPGLGRERRLPSVKLGPLHIWTMLSDKLEVGISADLRAGYHGNVFQRVYPNSIVWPEYRQASEPSQKGA
jgi:hypothetical protein